MGGDEEIDIEFLNQDYKLLRIKSYHDLLW